MKNICICGGGSIGHVISGYLGTKEGVKVNILTRKPAEWQKELHIFTPEGNSLKGKLNIVSNLPQESVTGCDIILICLPGYAIKEELERIKPYVSPGTYIGSVFSSTGFFFEAMKMFDDSIPLWGFQRVPFIARTKEYGKSAYLLGYKPYHNIAIEHCDNKKNFRKEIEQLLDRPVNLLNNYYEASFTNSNPLLHPARLYSLFSDWNKDIYYDTQMLFYEEWDKRASEILIALDKELFTILDLLPVSKDFLMPILKHYESNDADSLTAKIRSIESFKGIKTPMIKYEKGWQPDLDSRYFQEDFLYGLRYIYEKACELKSDVPVITKIFNWGLNLLNSHRQI